MPGSKRIFSHALYGSAAIVLSLVGCSSPAGTPSTAALNGGAALSANGRPVTAVRLPMLRSVPHYVPVVPDRHRTQTTFEYVINQYGSYATIVDYPKSTKQVGSINNVGGQGCTNVLYGYGKKIVWIVAGPDQIAEYQVPHTLIKTLSVPFSFPTSCAMDSSGDLAVGIYGTSGGGDVVVFKNATGTGTVYPTPLDEEFFDGYDPKGNLFADGFTGDRSGFALVELPKGGSKFKTIQTPNSIDFPGSVQWDGKYLSVFDQLSDATYQYTVSGTKATLKHTIVFTGVGDCAQTWNVGSLMYCGDADNNTGEVFKYPAGGAAVASFKGNFDTPLGVVAAEK